MIQVQPRVVRTRVMSHPSLAIDVGRVRMSGLLIEMPVRRGSRARGRIVHRWWSAFRRRRRMKLTATASAAFLLRHSTNAASEDQGSRHQ
jgi:hypothetical protein